MMKKTLATLSMVLTSTAFAATSYDGIITRLQDLAKKDHVKLFSLGKNDQNQDILGVLIGDQTKGFVKNLVVGTHHGNERMAAEVPFHFANVVLDILNNPNHPQHEQYQNTLFYVIPVLNISGYNVSRREETGPGNKNFDSNRDYEDPCSTKVDFRLKSTFLLSELIKKEDIVAAVTAHGYVGTFTFPWGVNTDNYKTLDDALMTDIAKKAVVHNHYKVGTHGAAIYPAAGAFEDWAYYKLGVWSFLLEIKNTSTDLKKDALALNEFFKLAPTERSHSVGQAVNCVDRILRTNFEGRP